MSPPSHLRFRVAEAVAAERLWARGDRVAVAVSGGADSVALLDLLLATQGMHGAVLSVVTVDHGQHAASAAHAAFVHELAEAAGLPCALARPALPPGSSEARCREARFAAFEALDVDRVALAHHRDDQAETVLLALIRGAGAAGRAAMAPRRGRYVRPLLGIGREALRAYAAARALRWVEDPTNADPRFLRNALRGAAIPALEAARPGAMAALARAARHAAEDEALLAALAAEHPGAATPGSWPRSFLCDAPPPIVRRALLAALPDATAGQLDAILAAARAGGGRVDLPGGRSVSIEGARVCLEPPAAAVVVVDDPHGYGPSPRLQARETRES